MAEQIRDDLRAMEVFNGVYSWDGKKHDDRDPIAWFPGSYHLHIFSIGADGGKVTSMRQHLCMYSETGNGHSISTNPEKFAKYICEDFGLDLERTLWVEINPSKRQKYEVVDYTRRGKMKDVFFYHMKKRQPNDQELQLIEVHLQYLDP